MNYPLIQYILAGGRNSEGLVDILIIVFFALIWIMRTFFLSQKEQNQQRKKSQTNKPPARNSLNKDRIEKFLENILQPKGPSAAQKNRQSIQQRPFNKKQIRYPQYNLKKSPFSGSGKNNFKSPQIQELPAIDPKLQELPELSEESTKTIDNLEMKNLTKHKDTAPSNYLSEMLFDKVDPDELKKAILYSEILGKPLSMRELLD